MEKQFSILFLFLQIIPGCHSSNDFTGIFSFPAPRNLRAEFFLTDRLSVQDTNHLNILISQEP